MQSTNENGFGSVEEVIDAVQEYNPRSRSKVQSVSQLAQQHDAMKKNLRFRDGRYYWHWDPRFISTGWPADGLERFPSFEEELTAELRKLNDTDVHCLLVRGKMTDVVSLEGVNLMRRTLDKFKVIDVAEAGHMVSSFRK